MSLLINDLTHLVYRKITIDQGINRELAPQLVRLSPCFAVHLLVNTVASPRPSSSKMAVSEHGTWSVETGHAPSSFSNARLCLRGQDAACCASTDVHGSFPG